jgi:MtN3/saliva family.
MIAWELGKASADSYFVSCRGVLMLKYSNMLNDPAMTRVNTVGLSLNLGYLICYYVFCDSKVSIAVIFSYTFLLPVAYAI